MDIEMILKNLETLGTRFSCSDNFIEEKLGLKEGTFFKNIFNLKIKIDLGEAEDIALTPDQYKFIESICGFYKLSIETLEIIDFRSFSREEIFSVQFLEELILKTKEHPYIWELQTGDKLKFTDYDITYNPLMKPDPNEFNLDIHPSVDFFKKRFYSKSFHSKTSLEKDNFKVSLKDGSMIFLMHANNRYGLNDDPYQNSIELWVSKPFYFGENTSYKNIFIGGSSIGDKLSILVERLFEEVKNNLKCGYLSKEIINIFNSNFSLDYKSNPKEFINDTLSLLIEKSENGEFVWEKDRREIILNILENTNFSHIDTVSEPYYYKGGFISSQDIVFANKPHLFEDVIWWEDNYGRSKNLSEIMLSSTCDAKVPKIFSYTFGASSYPEDDIYKLQLEDGTIISLIYVSDYPYDGLPPIKFAKELWISIPVQNTKKYRNYYICRNKDDGKISSLLNNLFNTVIKQDAEGDLHPNPYLNMLKELDI